MAKQVITGGDGATGQTGEQVKDIINENFDETYAHGEDTANPHTVTKAQVGLSNVDNTSDAGKPVSTAQATAIAVVQSDVNAHEALTNNPHSVTKTQIGLSNVDNTADTAKPVSTAQQTALDAKQPLVSRVQSVASAATVTPNADTDDMVKITAQAAALALANPTGTPTEGQGMVIRIKDNGTARAITYDTEYRVVGVTAPSTTVISKTLYIAMVRNATDTKWDIIGVKIQA